MTPNLQLVGTLDITRYDDVKKYLDMVREWYENEKTELQREKKRLTNNTQVKEEREDKLGHTNEKGPPRHLQCHLD